MAESKPLPPIRRYDLTHHHWNILSLAEGLKLIGWGLVSIALSIVISTAIVVTYLNGQL